MKTFGPGTGNGDAKRDAQAWLDAETHARLSGTAVDRRAARQPFGALWAEVHEATDYAPATRDLHRHVWRHVRSLERVPIGDVNSAVVSRILSRVDRPAMREKVRLVLSSVFAHAVEAGRIATNPARRQRAPRTRASRQPRNGRHRRLAQDELRRLVAEVPERYRALVRLMAHVGLRPGEAYALTVGQVGPVLTVDRSAAGPTKTGETREIPLPRGIHRLLQDYVAAHSDPTDPAALVFTSGEGEAVRHDSFRHLLARACRRAAIEPAVVPNDLRHTAAAFAIEHGASVYAVQRMLGHGRPSITLDTYGYLWDQSLEELAERLDAAIGAEFAPVLSDGE